MAGALADKFKFDLDGGTVALDFVNTVSGMRGFEPREHLFEYGDLVYWAQQAGLVDRRRAAALHAEAARHPRRAAEAFARAIAFREALQAVAAASISGAAPPQAALAAVNEWIAEALSHRRLRSAGPGRFTMQFDDDGEPLAFLRPVALDAADLLEHELAGDRMRICGESAIGRCGWLFLDETRNHSRRYCSMSECGNRAKQRRFQERRRAEQ